MRHIELNVARFAFCDKFTQRMGISRYISDLDRDMALIWMDPAVTRIVEFLDLDHVGKSPVIISCSKQVSGLCSDQTDSLVPGWVAFLQTRFICHNYWAAPQHEENGSASSQFEMGHMPLYPSILYQHADL